MDQEISCTTSADVSSSVMIMLVPRAEARAWMCPLHHSAGWDSRHRRMELALDLGSFLTISTTPPKEMFSSAPRLMGDAMNSSHSLSRMQGDLSPMASEAPVLGLESSLDAIALLSLIAKNVKLLSRTLITKPPSGCRRLCLMLTVSTMVVPPVVSFFVPTIVPSSLKSKVAVSSGNSQHPRLRMLSGLPMAPRLLSCANMELSLQTVSLSSSAPSVILFASSQVHGMSARLVAPAPNSLCTPHFTMSSIVSLLEILVLFVRWTILFMLRGLLRINYFALTGKPGQELLVLIQPRLVSSLLFQTRSMGKLCTWSNTAVSVAGQLSPTCNRRAFPKWLSTLSVIHKLGSVLLLLVETLRLPWRVHFLWSNSKDWMARHAMFGVNLAVKPFAKETIRLWR
mmetsp:Transcript_10477/g.18919  ORF Transcript_10477/g.18919 Transcript_10477/m.18919 type:complete len:398 (+) Transcript_10477:1107-2300(+)